MVLKTKTKLNSSFLVISIITLFVFIISFTAFYSKENFSAVCGCKLPIWVIIISIASFGMFVGSLIYYLLNNENIKEKKDIRKSIDKLLNMINLEYREVLKFISKNSGRVYQSQIAKELNLNKVKSSRILNELEKKGLIKKEKKGMTNLVKIDEDITELFNN